MTDSSDYWNRTSATMRHISNLAKSSRTDSMRMSEWHGQLSA